MAAITMIMPGYTGLEYLFFTDTRLRFTGSLSDLENLNCQGIQ